MAWYWTCSKIGGVFVLVLGLLLGCRGPETPYALKVGSVDEDGPQTAAAITISDPKVFARETLINDRRQEVAYLQQVLADSRYAQFEPDISRNLRALTATQFTGAVSVDPAKGLAARQQTDINELQTRLQLLRLERDIAEWERRVEEARRSGADIPDTVTPDGPKDENGARQAENLPNNILPEAPSTENIAFLPADSTKRNESFTQLQKALEVANSATQSNPLQSKSGLSPVEEFRERQSYRAEIRSALASVNLDDLHDYGGNALYRLQFSAFVAPGSTKNKYGTADLQVAAPKISKRELHNLYFGWLRYSSPILNDPFIEATWTDVEEYGYGFDRTKNSDRRDATRRSDNWAGKGVFNRLASEGYFRLVDINLGPGDACMVQSGTIIDCRPEYILSVLAPATVEAKPLIEKYFSNPLPGEQETANHVLQQIQELQRLNQQLKKSVPGAQTVPPNDGTPDWSCKLRGTSRGDTDKLKEVAGVLRIIPWIRAFNDGIQQWASTAHREKASTFASTYLIYYSANFENRILLSDAIDKIETLSESYLHASLLASNDPDACAQNLGLNATKKRPGIELPRAFISDVLVDGHNCLKRSDPHCQLEGSAYGYGTTPSQLSQRTSTIASSAKSLEVALAAAGSFAQAGVGAEAGFGFLRSAAGNVEALESVPLVVGYSNRRNPKKVPESESQMDARYGVPTFGWIFGPSMRLDPLKEKIVLEQRVRSHEVTADISVPGWWPHFDIQQRSAWVGNWSDGKDLLALTEGASRQTSLKVPLPRNDTLMEDLTTFLIGKVDSSVSGLSKPKIWHVSPESVSSCASSVTFVIVGRNIWRSTEIFIGGKTVRPEAISVLPDMKGVSATVPVNEFFSARNRGGQFLRDTVEVTVATRTGTDKSSIDVISPDTGSCSSGYTLAVAKKKARNSDLNVTPRALSSCDAHPVLYLESALSWSAEPPVFAVFGEAPKDANGNNMNTQNLRPGDLKGDIRLGSAKVKDIQVIRGNSNIARLTFDRPVVAASGSSAPLIIASSNGLFQETIGVLPCESGTAEAKEVSGTFSVMSRWYALDSAKELRVKLGRDDYPVDESELKLVVRARDFKDRYGWFIEQAGTYTISTKTIHSQITVPKTKVGELGDGALLEVGLKASLGSTGKSGQRYYVADSQPVVLYESTDAANVVRASKAEVDGLPAKVRFKLPKNARMAYPDLFDSANAVWLKVKIAEDAGFEIEDRKISIGTGSSEFTHEVTFAPGKENQEAYEKFHKSNDINLTFEFASEKSGLGLPDIHRGTLKVEKPE